MAIQGFPPYLVGTHISGALVSGCTVGSTGIITPVTTTGLTGDLSAMGVVDDFEIERSRSNVKIQPINSLFDNYVPLAGGFTATVREIRKGDGSSILDNIANVYEYMQVIFLVTPPGATTPTYTEAVIGLIENCRKAYVEEKHGVEVNLLPVGVATYSGTYVSAPFG